MNRPSAPSGLLVDFGGVLTTPVTRSFRLFCEETGLPRELVKEVFLEAYGNPGQASPVHQLETGAITAEEFALGLAASLGERAGIEISPEGLIERLFANVRLEERMFAAVERARGAGIRTGLLSNSFGTDAYPRDRFGQLFDAVVISGEEGLRKPDPAIYRLAAERLGLTPQACVFVDDLDTNVRAAEEVGMIGVLHRDPEDTLPVLERLFGLDPATLLVS